MDVPCRVAYPLPPRSKSHPLIQLYHTNPTLTTNTVQPSIHTQQTTQLEEMSTCLLTHVQD